MYLKTRPALDTYTLKRPKCSLCDSTAMDEYTATVTHCEPARYATWMPVCYDCSKPYQDDWEAFKILVYNCVEGRPRRDLRIVLGDPVDVAEREIKRS